MIYVYSITAMNNYVAPTPLIKYCPHRHVITFH